MQELIDKLKANAHLTDEQAMQVLATVKDYVKEKFPMLAGAVDNMLGGNS
jgi:dihydrodipicolinate synthase/N-acetylneuraminate lyase